MDRPHCSKLQLFHSLDLHYTPQSPPSLHLPTRPLQHYLFYNLLQGLTLLLSMLLHLQPQQQLSGSSSPSEESPSSPTKDSSTGAVVAGRRGRRSPPLFPHEIWNVVGRHHTGSSRTTNSLEAFQHAFNSLLTCQHPSIWILLKSRHLPTTPWPASRVETSRSLQYYKGRGTHG